MAKRDEEDLVIRIPRSQKPRSKELNEVLMTCKGGRMKNPKEKRVNEKRDIQRAMNDNE